MIRGFDAFISDSGARGRDELPLHLLMAYEQAREMLLADPTLANDAVEELGDGSYCLEHGGVLLLYEFENALVVKVFNVLRVFTP